MSLNKMWLPTGSVLAGIFVACASWGLLYHSAAIAPPVELHISANVIIGSHPDFRGDRNAPYTLVEFADYQCPPCNAANAQINGVLHQHKDKVRFTFRNFPLPMHEYALPAALAAETARKQGKFWLVHDALYAEQTQFSAAKIGTLLTTLGVKSGTRRTQEDAQQAVTQDKRTADSLHLTGTPTFVVCCPDGRVLQLHGLNQLEPLMR